MTQDTMQEVTSILIILSPTSRFVARSAHGLANALGKGNIIMRGTAKLGRNDLPLVSVDITATARKAGLIIDPSVRGTQLLLRRPS